MRIIIEFEEAMYPIDNARKIRAAAQELLNRAAHLALALCIYKYSVGDNITLTVLTETIADN